MAVKTKNVTVTKVPVEVLDLLRPYAGRDGRSEASDAAVMRFAAVELAKVKRAESKSRDTAVA